MDEYSKAYRRSMKDDDGRALQVAIEQSRPYPAEECKRVMEDYGYSPQISTEDENAICMTAGTGAVFLYYNKQTKEAVLQRGKAVIQRFFMSNGGTLFEDPVYH
jgi:hypothetical protein